LIIKNSKNQPTEQNLVQSDRVNDYAELFEKYQAELLRYLFSLLNEVETTRDIVQETFVKGYEVWLTKPAEVSNWRPLLYKIATNLTLDWFRRSNKIYFSSWDKPETESGLAESDKALPRTLISDPARNTEVRLQVLTALRGLSSSAATCLLLHYDQGFSCAEIAQITGSSVEATWQRLSRARKAFCALYQNEEKGANE
jgi:RNA polymerase sigma-70 factor, ECF subfamily